MSGTQLSFTLKSSANVRGVQLLGSWDNYQNSLPLARDTSSAVRGSKNSAWKATFRFPASTMPPGQRYWYYYILDGHHVSHDPAKPSTVEPTTGRRLNILDVPRGGSTTAPSARTGSLVVGRGLSPSRIVAPRPSKPYASRAVREADYNRSPVDELTGDLDSLRILGRGSSISPASSSSPSSASTRSARSGSSLSSLSDSGGSDGSAGSRCSCRRYGITRRGDKVLLDCGGARCGYAESDSSENSQCSSSGSEIDSDSDDEPVQARVPVRKMPTKQASSRRRSASSRSPTRAGVTKGRSRVPATTTRRR